MITIDYLVCTWPASDKTEAHLVRIKARVAEGQKQYRLGFVGKAVPQLFVGENPYTDRVMVHSSGGMADIVSRLIPQELDEGMSVARIDIALTATSSNADAEIAAIKPRPGYKSAIYVSLGEPGSTLYVGAPSSRCRLRVYNKSAESDIQRDDGLEYIRYEVQLRNEYADRAWRAFRRGELAKHFLSVTMRMIEQDYYERISRAINEESSDLEPIFLESEHEDWAERRLRWIEMSVVPAIAKLINERPELTDTVKGLLDRIPRRVV